MRSPALLLLWSLALACGGGTPAGKGPKIGRAQSVHSAPVAELPIEFRGQVPVLQNSSVLGMLPDTTMAAVVGKSLRHLANTIEFAEILREYSEFFSSANVALSAPQDAKLLEPATWSNLGIDVDAPFGMAFLVRKRAVGLFFAPLTDSKAFLSSVPVAAQAVGLGTVHQSSVGERHIFRFKKDDEVALLVNAGSVVLILADRSTDLDAVLADLLGSSGQQTLAQSGRLAKSFTEFDYGEDVAGFVAFDTFAARISEDRNRDSGDNYWLGQLDEMEKRVEAAKSQAKPQNEIDQLEEKLADVLEEYNAFALRESAEAHFTDNILGDLGTVVFGLDFGGPSTGVRARITATPGSLADRLFLSGGGPLRSPKHLVEEPMWMLAGHVDRVAALEVFKTLLNMEGETVPGLTSEVRNELQIDLSAWLGQVGGEVAGALTLNRDMLLSAKNSYETLNAFGVHIMAEMRNEEAAQKLFDKALQSPALRRYASGTGKNAALEIEGFNARPIRITLADGFLDARSVGPKPSTPAWRDHEASQAGSPQTLALMAFDPMLLQWLWFADPYYYDEHLPRANNTEPNAAEKARLEALAKKEEALRRKRTVIRNTRFVATSKTFGRLLVTARREPSGSLAILGALIGTASNFGRGIQAVAESIDSALVEQRTGKPSALKNVETELRKLQSEETLDRCANSIDPLCGL